MDTEFQFSMKRGDTIIYIMFKYSFFVLDTRQDTLRFNEDGQGIL